MLALLYLALSFAIGIELCASMLPLLDGSGLPDDRRHVARWVISWPAAFLVGTLLMTWATYLVAWSFSGASRPLAYANAIVMVGALLGLVLRVVRAPERSKLASLIGARKQVESTTTPIAARRRWLDGFVAATALVIGTAIMLHTCRIEGTTLILGRTAFGDLNVHLGMARSFSQGNNFPTGYVAYAGTDIRYHFMFYFLVGNLEFLGLRLDWALNLPSILSFVSALLLMHGVGSVIGRDRRVGALAVLFFLLRSSPAFFVYVSRLKAPHLSGRVAEFFAANRYIGITQNETWGIWNLNVYIVERHFAFAFGLVLIAVLYLVRASGLDSGASLLHPLSDPKRRPAFGRD